MSLCRFMIILASFTLLGACGTVYPPDVPPGYNTGSARLTTYYLQWAFENEQPYHVANCLSAGLKEREGFTDSQLETFWPEVKAWAAQHLGDVQRIEIESIEDLPATGLPMKIVTYRLGERLIPVRFIRQTTWEIRHVRPTVETQVERPTQVADIATLQGNDLTIRLTGLKDPGQFSPENIEKIIITSAWLVDSVDPKEMERLGLRPPEP